MNIAIMFCGEFRWFESFQKSFRANFKPSLAGHNVQYFGHFWDYGLEKLQDFVDTCGPTILELESKKSDAEIKDFLGFTKTINGTLPNQTYCIYKAFTLLEKYQRDNNTKFDLYIRMRPDLFFPERVNFNEFDDKSVYSKKCHPGTTTSTFLCDFAYFTKNYDAVQKMASFGKCFDAILNDPNPIQYKEFLEDNIYCPEELLARHANIQGLSLKLHEFELYLARNHI